MNTEPTIYEKLLAAGVEIDNHVSDLYVPVSETTNAIIATYEYKQNVTKFTSAIDGTPWYDIPFAYDPWVTEKHSYILKKE